MLVFPERLIDDSSLGEIRRNETPGLSDDSW